MDQNLSQLLGLGPNAEWPYTEKSLIELIQLQREKELTKQQYYKSENLKLSLELMDKCVNVDVPGRLIPLVFTGEAVDEDYLERLQVSSQQRQVLQTRPAPQPNYPPQYQQPFQGHNRTISVPPQLSSYQYPPRPANSAPSFNPQRQTTLAPPVTFTRPTSPAKRGAAAVAQLDRPTPPHFNNSHRSHKRNHSLPSPIGNHRQAGSAYSASRLSRSPSGVNGTPGKIGTMDSMMRTINSIQFINENPAKCTRKRNKDEDGSGREEDKENSNSKRPFVFEEYPNPQSSSSSSSSSNSTFQGSSTAIGNEHKRTKSDNFIIMDRVATMNDKVEVGHNLLKASDGRAGPKFANNILE